MVRAQNTETFEPDNRTNTEKEIYWLLDHEAHPPSPPQKKQDSNLIKHVAADGISLNWRYKWKKQKHYQAFNFLYKQLKKQPNQVRIIFFNSDWLTQTHFKSLLYLRMFEP